MILSRALPHMRPRRTSRPGEAQKQTRRRAEREPPVEREEDARVGDHVVEAEQRARDAGHDGVLDSKAGGGAR